MVCSFLRSGKSRHVLKSYKGKRGPDSRIEMRRFLQASPNPGAVAYLKFHQKEGFGIETLVLDLHLLLVLSLKSCLSSKNLRSLAPARS